MSILPAILTRKMHISAMGDGNMLDRKKLSGFPKTEKGDKKTDPKIRTIISIMAGVYGEKDT